MTYEPFIIDYG